MWIPPLFGDFQRRQFEVDFVQGSLSKGSKIQMHAPPYRYFLAMYLHYYVLFALLLLSILYLTCSHKSNLYRLCYCKSHRQNGVSLLTSSPLRPLFFPSLPCWWLFSLSPFHIFCSSLLSLSIHAALAPFHYGLRSSVSILDAPRCDTLSFMCVITLFAVGGLRWELSARELTKQFSSSSMCVDQRASEKSDQKVFDVMPDHLGISVLFWLSWLHAEAAIRDLSFPQEVVECNKSGRHKCNNN